MIPKVTLKRNTSNQKESYLGEHRKGQHEVYDATNKIKLPILLPKFQYISQSNLQVFISILQALFKHQIVCLY